MPLTARNESRYPWSGRNHTGHGTNGHNIIIESFFCGYGVYGSGISRVSRGPRTHLRDLSDRREREEKTDLMVAHEGIVCLLLFTPPHRYYHSLGTKFRRSIQIYIWLERPPSVPTATRLYPLFWSSGVHLLLSCVESLSSVGCYTAESALISYKWLYISITKYHHIDGSASLRPQLAKLGHRH